MGNVENSPWEARDAQCCHNQGRQEWHHPGCGLETKCHGIIDGRRVGFADHDEVVEPLESRPKAPRESSSLERRSNFVIASAVESRCDVPLDCSSSLESRTNFVSNVDQAQSGDVKWPAFSFSSVALPSYAQHSSEFELGNTGSVKLDLQAAFLFREQSDLQNASSFSEAPHASRFGDRVAPPAHDTGCGVLSWLAVAEHAEGEMSARSTTASVEESDVDTCEDAWAAGAHCSCKRCDCCRRSDDLKTAVRHSEPGRRKQALVV